MTSARSLTLAAACAAALAATSVPASAAQTAGTTGSTAPPRRYVALGDSYAAGSGVPRQSAGLCLRSDRNYPSLLAARLRAAATVDVTCGGAKTKHMAEPHVYPVIGKVNDPQLNAVTADTELVTLTIGGNDLGSTDAGVAGPILKCVALAQIAPWGSPCAWHYKDTLSYRINDASGRVASTLREIHNRAPRAKIMLVGYPAVLPENEWDCLGKQPVTVFDAAFLRDTVKELNRVLAREAKAGGAVYVDTYTPTIGHDICSTDRWIAGIVPTEPSLPVHPNARGQQALADAVAAAIG
ncbi:SGNH/GDSL hydrolase family protein [Streptomyces sp. NPDC059874]|uniref:SGNH/GDSL hydrolase family protein n=1 Tax=Streptomyces sp. NPDC059874 TaxID=3346983 RepID=UPI0036561D15